MRKRQNINIHINWPLIRPTSLGAIAIILGFTIIGSVVMWGCALSGIFKNFRQIRNVVVVVGILVLAINVYVILFKGYVGFLEDLKISIAGYSFCSVIGFFISRVDLIPLWKPDSIVLKCFINFLLYIPVAYFLAVLPALLISFGAWLIMALFGEDI